MVRNLGPELENTSEMNISASCCHVAGGGGLLGCRGLALGAVFLTLLKQNFDEKARIMFGFWRNLRLGEQEFDGGSLISGGVKRHGQLICNPTSGAAPRKL